MSRFGYFLSAEDHTPAELIEQAELAQQAGFESLWISDHYHPWNDQQGESAFVWTIIGALAQATDLPITTAVTCPTVRIHPAIIAQAAATSAALLGPDRFILGLGSGEALNEHILGDAWPNAATRLAMLEEAIEIIRELWTGEVVSREGEFYTVDAARIYTLPDQPPPIYVSSFGPKSLELTCRIADGFISTQPDAESVAAFRKAKGKNAPAQVGFKASYAETREQAIDHMYRLWPNDQLPGELAQVLPSPQHFEQASELVTREMVGESPAPLGPDAETHLAAFDDFVDAGFDVVHLSNVGPDYRGFFKLYETEVLPELKKRHGGGRTT
ncbi:TIGR03557 family F420-dependent LLM class oxidoreductase [Blastococcus sp. Marseille-P5729]|uniref:TIGR03557 family F420-dependent LLM class oxidoreductase n=1 Tax=Blastococcus sp. Marseille-P5729 TaxID=2086582 RepID=UPI000D10EA4D|nr:TIGR03557 family F420-dependent LLM class oxidoreductase [Blastococcus sp. Marseille-P5729]